MRPALGPELMVWKARAIGGWWRIIGVLNAKFTMICEVRWGCCIDSHFSRSLMSGNLLALMASRRSGLLLTGLVVALVVAGGGNAADLRLPISFASLPKAEFDRFLANRPI